MYAPLDGRPDAFHRTLFLFVSPAGDRLAQSGAVRALRCQLARDNPYYPPDPPTRRDLLPPLLPPGARHAALAADPWRVGEAERDPAQWPRAAGAAQRQQQAPGSPGGGPRLFPEAELVVEPEEEGGGSGGGAEGAAARAAELLREYRVRSEQVRRRWMGG